MDPEELMALDYADFGRLEAAAGAQLVKGTQKEKLTTQVQRWTDALKSTGGEG